MKITACVIFALLFLAQNPAKKPDGNSHDDQPKPNTTSPSPVTVNCNQSTGAVAEHKEQKAPKWYASIQGSNWALVLIGGITAWAVWFQAQKTAEATQAMRDSIPHQKNAADAALLNAQALINSERPWVMIQIETIPDKGGKATATFLAKVFNYGKGPAHITDCSKVKIEFLKNPIADLKIPPVYLPQPDWQKRFLAPQDSFPVELINPWDETVKDLKAIVAFGDTPVNYRDLILVAYGKIEYTDGISSKTYTTAFCYKHERVRLSQMGGYLIPCGPPVYNEYS